MGKIWRGVGQIWGISTGSGPSSAAVGLQWANLGRRRPNLARVPGSCSRECAQASLRKDFLTNTTYALVCGSPSEPISSPFPACDRTHTPISADASRIRQPNFGHPIPNLVETSSNLVGLNQSFADPAEHWSNRAQVLRTEAKIGRAQWPEGARVVGKGRGTNRTRQNLVEKNWPIKQTQVRGFHETGPALVERSLRFIESSRNRPKFGRNRLTSGRSNPEFGRIEAKLCRTEPKFTSNRRKLAEPKPIFAKAYRREMPTARSGCLSKSGSPNFWPQPKSGRSELKHGQAELMFGGEPK